jgi:thiol-disulfide isomerase/thioredoxin
MSRYLHLLLLTSTLLLFFGSCKEKSRTYKPTTTTIEGTITSAVAPVIILRGTEDIKASITQEGKFFIQAELDRSGIYTLLHGDQSVSLYIVPGDRISVIGDYRTLDAATKFSGSHELENNYLIHYHNLQLVTEPQDMYAFFSKNETDFLKAVEDRLNVFIEDQQEYQKKNGAFEEDFAELMSAELSYDAANLKMTYPEYYTYIMPDSTLNLSDTYDSFFQNLDIDTDANLLVPSYIPFISLYLDFNTKADTTAAKTALVTSKFNNIKTLFKSPKVKEVLYYNLLKNTLSTSINETSLVIDKYRTAQTNPTFLEDINNQYQQWQHLIVGQPAPKFDYKDINGRSVSLESLAGKVVYIDVWATWCGPCLRELPALEKLQEENKSNNDITFVSISIDQDKAAWEKMVRAKNMKGVQLFAEGDWASSLVSDYRISGIPRFIVIGKDGKIIDANAPRPSSKEIAGLLDNASKS